MPFGAAQPAAEKPQQPARPARAAQQPKEPAPRTEEPRRRRGRQPADEDPGLLLITRRPPKQKFANFEEYIAAHGGATAPIVGEDPEPAAPAPTPAQDTPAAES